MPLNFGQIVAQCCQSANVPGYTAQGGLILTAILQDLANDYDFAAARGTFNFTLPTVLDAQGRAFMNFPPDYLRALRDECFYYISGVPYDLIPVDLDQFDQLVLQAGLQNFPTVFAVDVAQTPPVAYFWMPPSGAFPAILRYQRLMPDTANNAVPWFPNQMYLITRLTGELCKFTDDDRAERLLTNDEKVNSEGAGCILRRYLVMKDDQANRAKTVTLDRRRFGTNFQNLRNTKLVGW